MGTRPVAAVPLRPEEPTSLEALDSLGGALLERLEGG
jgi:hypothetical protein